MSLLQKKQNSLSNTKSKKTETPIRVTDKRFWVNKEKEASKDEKEYSFKPTYVQELEKKVNEVQKNAEIEVQKSRERIRNEHEKRILQSKGDLVKEFLDVFENLERALNASKKTPNFQGLIEGVGLIHNQFSNGFCPYLCFTRVYYLSFNVIGDLIYSTKLYRPFSASHRHTRPQLISIKFLSPIIIFYY